MFAPSQFADLIAGLEGWQGDRGQPRVDVVMNVYGKPMNTAATLYSLLKHSGRWIDKIYFITERKQPAGSNFDFIKAAVGKRLVSYTPPLWLWVRPFHHKWLFRLPFFRRSVRYQYGWEQTDKDYLFITHNDVLYTADIIGAMLGQVGAHIGIGPVGQCWNCSAHFAGVCTPDTYTQYKPDYEELLALMKQYPGKREKDYGQLPYKDRPWPLPECRLNEWAALINMRQARNITMPHGDALPFGAFFDLDIATRWFSDVHSKGHTVANFNLHSYGTHAWAGTSPSGHIALADKNEYEYAEKRAEAYLATEIDSNT